MRFASDSSSRSVHFAIFAVVLGALFFIGSALRSPNATTKVDCDGGGDLQAAIDAAASGVTIFVEGTCIGDFTIDDDVWLRGKHDATLRAAT